VFLAFRPIICIGKDGAGHTTYTWMPLRYTWMPSRPEVSNETFTIGRVPRIMDNSMVFASALSATSCRESNFAVDRRRPDAAKSSCSSPACLWGGRSNGSPISMPALQPFSLLCETMLLMLVEQPPQK
jgi:hypothetical protein